MMETKVITENISEAAQIIRNGGLVAVPTETVYGLAGNGLDEKAVSDIYEVKGRPEVKPLSLMVAGAQAIEQCCEDVPQAAYTLADKFWPGPLTIILKSKSHVPEITRAGGETVGLRCPDHPLTLELLRKAGVPLAAPSANPSGEPSPKNAQTVLKYFDGKIDAVIDGGECGIGTESTIIDLSKTPYRILRQGALGEDEIFDALQSGMKIVGITGGSGCGKTTALNVLERMGALVIDCDALYHELTETSEEMRAELISRFGEVYDGNTLDRKKLGEVVFGDKDELLALNEITHKFVRAGIAERLRKHALSGGTLAAIDAIALIEGTSGKLCSVKFGVLAPIEERVKRLLKREGVTEEYARKRIAAQKSDSFFEENCDYILRNDADMESFNKQCEKIFTEVLNK
ncbi:MAG: threonylcarbamoyl-AMP synthase [Oscillospiraceae bacterium]|nr:threonylcarbamoyl-AMP synthase [Oscillospiraceae bacterium]